MSAPYGVLADGRTVEQHVLRNAHGTEVRFISYGGTITDVLMPGGDNVVLGFADLAGYVGRPGVARPYLGALIGRFANRIGGARFALDGVEHRLSANEGPNCLHGGADGFDRQVWEVEADPAAATLRHTSPDGSNGFPGTLDVTVTYALTDANELHMGYAIRTDRDTVVNLTNHSYFNLAGAGSIDGHEISIAADAFLPVDAALLPEAPAPVLGTPFDLRAPVRIGDALAWPHEQLLRARGFDHCFILSGRVDSDGLRDAATLHDPGSGRRLTVRTDQPAVQFYTGNSLDGSATGRTGAAYRQGAGLALETQHYPDSPNHRSFPSCVLRACEERAFRTVLSFG